MIGKGGGQLWVRDDGTSPVRSGGSLSPSSKRDRAGPAEGRGRARGLGPASRTRDPPRAGEGLRWGGAANPRRPAGQTGGGAIDRRQGSSGAPTELAARVDAAAAETLGCGAGRSLHAGGSSLGLGRSGLLGWENRGSLLLFAPHLGDNLYSQPCLQQRGAL